MCGLLGVLLLTTGIWNLKFIKREMIKEQKWCKIRTAASFCIVLKIPNTSVSDDVVFADCYCAPKCSAGYYSVTGYQPSCLPCPVGFISTAAGATSCQECPAGETTQSQASTFCVADAGREREGEREEYMCVLWICAVCVCTVCVSVCLCVCVCVCMYRCL